MRSFLFLISIVSICFNSYSQIFAGYQLTEYTDIIPDTLIDYYPCGPGPSITENYYIDVNVDSQNDFRIKAYCGVSPGQTSRSISISSLNPNWYSMFGHTDTVYTYINIAKPLYYGDTINSPFAVWDSTTLYLSLFSHINLSGEGTSFDDWTDTIDEYIGIKYQTPSDTSYGWIRVNCPNAGNCYLKDYSFGALAVSIKEFEPDNVLIYPNPASNTLTIASNFFNKEVQLQITDLFGREIKSMRIKDEKIIIDVSDFNEGVYFLIFKAGNRMTVKKIAVQRN